MAQLSAKKALFGLDVLHGEKWKHTSECPVSQAVWDGARGLFLLPLPEYWVMSYRTGGQLAAERRAARAWKLSKEC